MVAWITVDVLLVAVVLPLVAILGVRLLRPLWQLGTEIDNAALLCRQAAGSYRAAVDPVRAAPR